MKMYINLNLLLLSFFLSAKSLGASLHERDVADDKVADVDVAVIGGGSAGTYSAVRLRDMNKTVAVIEQKDRLGGHTETYVDPQTGGKTEIGVIVWYNESLVTNYFDQLHVPLVASILGGTSRIPVDFSTGQPLSNYTRAEPSAALAAYGAQLAQYPYLEDGYNLPSPVPEDLLLPFGTFVEKYNLGPAVYTISSFNQGQDVLSAPTLYVFKLFSLGVLQGLTNGFLTTANHDNSELYRNAEAFLGPNVYLGTTISAVDRTSLESSIRLTLSTPSGSRTLTAKKLLIAIPPTVTNLASLDLTDTECSLFSQFQSRTYETGVIRNSGIPANVTLGNVDPSANPYGVPPLPATYAFSATGLPNLISVKYGADSASSSNTSADARAAILTALDKIRNAGQIPGFDADASPEFATYSSHSPFELTVSTDAIRDGFYDRLNALQGQKNTWYTGAAWQAHDSSAIWRFTEGLLPRIFAE